MITRDMLVKLVREWLDENGFGDVALNSPVSTSGLDSLDQVDLLIAVEMGVGRPLLEDPVVENGTTFDQFIEEMMEHLTATPL